jgi:hypothetical protein
VPSFHSEIINSKPNPTTNKIQPQNEEESKEEFQIRIESPKNEEESEEEFQIRLESPKTEKIDNNTEQNGTNSNEEITLIPSNLSTLIPGEDNKRISHYNKSLISLLTL